jgi:putative ABC transport system permease protein
MQLLRRLLHLVRRQQFENDLAEEMEFHRQMAQEELGSVRRIGNTALARDEARDVWVWPWLQDIAYDFRFACRMLAKERRFTAATLVTLGLGIGANTAAFTLLNSVMQDPPYVNSSRLVNIRTIDSLRFDPANPFASNLGVSYQDFLDWRRSARTFSELAISSEQPMNIGEEGMAPQRYAGAYVSANLFRMLGRSPILGRDFTDADERPGAQPVVMLAHTVWRTRYSSDPGVIGRTVRVNDVPSVIVGVMPERFHFPLLNEVWQPVGVNVVMANARREVRTPIVMAFGRMASDVTIEQAQSELDSVCQNLAKNFPATNSGIKATLTPLKQLIIGGGLAQMAALLMVAVVFVLIIACVNVGNLLLARTNTRSREIAVRASLGATRGRIIRQLMIESLALAGVAGLIGLAIGHYSMRLLAASFTPQLQGAPVPYWLTLDMNLEVFAFVATICIGTTILFGLAPALRVSRTNVNQAMKDGGRGTISARSHRWSGTLVVAQLSLTLVLLAGTATMGRQFLEIYRAGQVIDTTGIVTLRLALSVQKYRTPEMRKLFFKQLEEALAGNQVLSMATVASDIPFVTMSGARRELSIEGREWPTKEPPPTVAYGYVGPRYFDTLKIPIVRGRGLTDEDGRPGQEGIVVNERFASLYFAGSNPIGQRIRLANAAAPQVVVPWFTIVGVSRTVPWMVSQAVPEPVAYVPVAAEPAPHRFASILARSRSDTSTAITQLREEVRRIDPDLPGYATQTLDEVLAASRFPQRLLGTILLVLASLALILATVGLFALTAAGVAERTQEIGVRLALGAEARAVVWMFMRQAVLLLTIGLSLGLAGAAFSGKYVGTMFGRGDQASASILGAISAVLIVVGLTASLLPARRAARIDPLVALRYD